MSGRRNPFRDGLFRLPGGQFSDFVFGQAENRPFVHRHGSERTVEGDRRCVPIQYDPLHPSAAPLGGELDQMKQQPFPVSAPSVLLIDVYVFQVETALSPESREVMEEQSEPYGSPVQLAQHDFRLSFFKKGFAERLLGRIHFALELFVAVFGYVNSA